MKKQNVDQLFFQLSWRFKIILKAEFYTVINLFKKAADTHYPIN